MATDSIAKLRAKLDELEEENRQLREIMRPPVVMMPGVLALTQTESRVLDCLYRRNTYVSREAILMHCNGLLSTTNAKCIDVHIMRIRRKIKAYALKIETIWGGGFYLPPGSRANLKVLLEKEELHGGYTTGGPGRSHTGPMPPEQRRVA